MAWPLSNLLCSKVVSFQLYSGGIYDDPTCGTMLDHGVLLVGYDHDRDTGTKYWIVKNSWGSAWGENGYIRLAKDIMSSSGQCGIAMDPSYPIVHGKKYTEYSTA